MITETLQAFILATYCFVLWVGFCHFTTSLVLSLCTPIHPNVPADLDRKEIRELKTAPIQSLNSSLAQKGIRELKAMASARKIRGYGKMSKVELIDILS